MNIIQKQADVFIKRQMNDGSDYKEFIEKVRSNLWEYKKTAYKIEFVERVIQCAKIAYDEHLIVCKNKDNDKCRINSYYENSLFFLQEELEELEGQISPEDFTRSQKTNTNQALQKIIDDLNEIKLGQQIIYDDLNTEFEEMKDLYYLNKKNWTQLFTGKLSEMIASGVISETISKNIINVIKDNYQELIV